MSEDKGNVRRVEWEEYSNLCRLLAGQILERHHPDSVVGIAHGGVIVGATVATLLKRDFFPVKFSRRVNARVVRKTVKMLVPPTADLEGKSVLLIDDASMTGETMKAAVRAIKKRGAREVVTAVLVRRGAYQPDFSASYFAGRVIFPWQIEEEPKDKRPGQGGEKK